MIFFEKRSFINFKNVASKAIQHLNPPDLCLKGTQPKERKKTSPGTTGYQSIKKPLQQRPGKQASVGWITYGAGA